MAVTLPRSVSDTDRRLIRISPCTGEVCDFITFARTEGRFAKQFDNDGNPSELLLRTNEERLRNWHLLQELAGMR